MLLYEGPIGGTLIPKLQQYSARHHSGLSMHPHIAYYYITVTNEATTVE